MITRGFIIRDIREYNNFYYQIFEKVSDNWHRANDLATKVPADFYTLSERVLRADSLVAGIGAGILGYALFKEKLRGKTSSSAESPSIPPVTEQIVMPKNLRIPRDVDSIVIWDSSGRSDIKRTDTETQIIFAYPDGSEPLVIEHGSRVHPNELDELVATFYQSEDAE